MEPKARVDRAEQAQATGNDTRRRVARSGISDIMINSLIAPQHSRLTHFDALLTLNASYSLFRLSPVEKQYLIVFLGPSLYRAVGIGTTVKQNIIGLSQAKKITKSRPQMRSAFCWAYRTKLQPHRVFICKIPFNDFLHFN